MTRLSWCLVLLTVPSAAACGDDAVSYSDPVGLSFSVSSGDVGGDGVLLDEKNINTESGNPYAAYIAAAEDEIGGLPSRISVDSATLEIVDGSVDALEAIYDDAVDITFVMNSSDAAFPVATLTVVDGDGAGPVAADVAFDSDDVDDANYDDLVGGSFKVELAGLADAGFEALGGDADLTLVLTFTAYE